MAVGGCQGESETSRSKYLRINPGMGPWMPPPTSASTLLVVVVLEVGTVMMNSEGEGACGDSWDGLSVGASSVHLRLSLTLTSEGVQAT